MATGFFLYHLDKTTCGGRILSGAPDDTYEIGGVVRQQVREGDPVTCGKHKGRFRVCGGMGDTYSVNGAPKEWAGSLDSFSSCPCRARFVPTVFSHTYESDCNASRVAERAREADKKALIAQQDIMPTNSLPGAAAASAAVLVFAKSVLRGTGNTDAGTADEPQTNIGEMSFFQSRPSQPAPEPAQHAQAAKKKTSPPPPPPPEPPKKKSLFDKVTGFFFGEAEAMPLHPPPVVMGGSAEAGMAAAAGGATAKANQDAAKALTHTMKHLSGPEVLSGSIAMNLPFVLMGVIVQSKLKGEKSDLLTHEKLLEVAHSKGTVPTRVRYNWITDDETGRLKAVGYHTSPESARDQVKVRLMEKRFDGKYRFWGDGPGGKVQITWTPADAPGNTNAGGWHTGNEGQSAGTVTIPGLENPDIQGVTITTTPVPEEKDFRDYILVFPGNIHPPIYIYLSKPPVQLLEVNLYSNFTGRPRNGTHADHMPSAAAVRAFLRRQFPDAKPSEIDSMAKDVAAVIIPAEIHQKLSVTYGGRNNPVQIEQDSKNLRAALERDIETIRPALKERGLTDGQIDEAKAKMHQLNQGQGLY
ncbi:MULTISPECIES: S-type pyocin domain-containing protein [Enterobacter]|uniref:S-type pyocin domain-containing protein n=1 Tax=Enterobacter TaxID=547 RepID=UPI001C8D0425|nr:S-type pyocin domain-containing protein [Enterobacter sp. NIC22-4]MBY0634473.1 S-type pyocin domain-containing protein [Enterobacter sp. NIC22-4]